MVFEYGFPYLQVAFFTTKSIQYLAVINLNGVLCVDNREVSDILRIEHKEIFRKIKGRKNLKGYTN